MRYGELSTSKLKRMIRVGRFPDGRLKVLRIYNRSDRNVRINEDEISVCHSIRQLRLEQELIEAVSLWNLLKVMPNLRKDIDTMLKQYLGKGLDDLLDLGS